MSAMARNLVSPTGSSVEWIAASGASHPAGAGRTGRGGSGGIDRSGRAGHRRSHPERAIPLDNPVMPGITSWWRAGDPPPIVAWTVRAGR